MRTRPRDLPRIHCATCERAIRLPAAKTLEERQADIEYYRSEYGDRCRRCWERARDAETEAGF